ncbi:MAG: hypothetical protein NTZ30_03200, partial [Planctomycetota bacterium]|nr:hypothetical protein [Planctomycetota bacterium]
MLKFSGIILLMCLLAMPSIAQDHLSKEDTRLFMKKLATFVAEKHMRTSKETMQHGMTYEYRDMRKEKAPACFVQGEALDTMHDGAWFG